MMWTRTTTTTMQSGRGGWQANNDVDDCTPHGMTSTPPSDKYKWAMSTLQIIQSILISLANTIIQFCSSITPLSTFYRLWQHICALPGKMTVEILNTEVKEEKRDSDLCGMGLPVLRLNSVTMEEFLRDGQDSGIGGGEHEQDGCSSASEFHPSSSCYNSSDAETDSGIQVFNDEAEEFIPMKNSNKNLPQEFPSRRDSDTSDDGISDEQKSELVIQKLISQVEMMFSDEHLAKDGFLLKHVRRRSDGFVSLKLVAGLRKVKQISRDFQTVLSALRLSLRLDVNLDGTKIRRMEPLTPYLKALPISGGTKEKEAGAPIVSNKSRPSAEFTQDELLNRVNMKNCTSKQGNGQHKRIQRNNSNASSGSSNPGSRHGSFSHHYQNQNTSPAELFYRNVPALTAEEQVQVNRRRGGSLPIPMAGQGHNGVAVGGPSPSYYQYQRNSMYLSPNSSPPSGSEFQRPKSNSYCEGTGNKNSPSQSGGMSVWLQRRMASTRSSEGTIVLTGVLRQPRGPDGTKGFASGYRDLIVEETESTSVSA